MGGIISCHFCLFVVLCYPSFLSLFCSCSFWDVLRMHHLVLLTFPASACFRPPTAKKKDNSPTKPGAEKIWNIINLVAINVLIPCNNVWHGDEPHLVFGHKIDGPTAPSHPFAPILPTKPNLSNLVQTKLLQSSPICQPGSNQTAPIKSNLLTLDQTKVSNQVQLVKAKAEFSNQVQFVRASTGIAGCKSVEAFHTWRQY